MPATPNPNPKIKARQYWSLYQQQQHVFKAMTTVRLSSFVPVGLGCGVLEDDEMLPEALGESEDEAKPVAIRIIE